MRTKFLATLLVASTLLVGCSSSDKSSTSSSTAAPTESEVSSTSTASSQSKSKAKAYGIGETIEVDGIKLTINSATSLNEVDQFYTASDLEEGKTYEIIDATIENDRNEEVLISSFLHFHLKDGEGRNEATPLISVRGNGTLDGTIIAGDVSSGELIYMAPAEGELNLYFTSPGDNGQTVKINIRK